MEDRQCVWIQVDLTREKYEEESTSRATRLSQRSNNPNEAQVKEAQLKVASFDTCLCLQSKIFDGLFVYLRYMSPDSRLWDIGRWWRRFIPVYCFAQYGLRDVIRSWFKFIVYILPRLNLMR